MAGHHRRPPPAMRSHASKSRMRFTAPTSGTASGRRVVAAPGRSPRWEQQRRHGSNPKSIRTPSSRVRSEYLHPTGEAGLATGLADHHAGELGNDLGPSSPDPPGATDLGNRGRAGLDAWPFLL